MTLAIEQEILEKFRQLDHAAKLRVRKAIQELVVQDSDFDVQIQLRPDADGTIPSASDMVNEVREERDAEIMRSIFGDSTHEAT